MSSAPAAERDPQPPDPGPGGRDRGDDLAVDPATGARRKRVGAARVVCGSGGPCARARPTIRPRARTRVAAPTQPTTRSPADGRGRRARRALLAGGDAVEVGGDWYDAVRRPDGIIQLCVGDVSGQGIGAATMMGRQRNTFHAYALDHVSPAEIIRRMLRHARDDEMITVACVSLDPCTGGLSIPAPGILRRWWSTGGPGRDPLDAPARLRWASASPQTSSRRASRCPGSILGIYTDGLIERRGPNIDAGVDLLGRVIARRPASMPRPTGSSGTSVR